MRGAACQAVRLHSPNLNGSQTILLLEERNNNNNGSEVCFSVEGRHSEGPSCTRTCTNTIKQGYKIKNALVRCVSMTL